MDLDEMIEPHEKYTKLISLSSQISCYTRDIPHNIHARGFFGPLQRFATSMGDKVVTIIDPEDRSFSFDVSIDGSEDDYFSSLQSAPLWDKKIPFTYAINTQVYIGDRWYMRCERDEEMCQLLVFGHMSQEQKSYAELIE